MAPRILREKVRLGGADGAKPKRDAQGNLVTAIEEVGEAERICSTEVEERVPEATLESVAVPPGAATPMGEAMDGKWQSKQTSARYPLHERVRNAAGGACDDDERDDGTCGPPSLISDAAERAGEKLKQERKEITLPNGSQVPGPEGSCTSSTDSDGEGRMKEIDEMIQRDAKRRCAKHAMMMKKMRDRRSEASGGADVRNRSRRRSR